ncbi:MAG TPA: hypothetical protein VGI81_06645 [Tepidisphaeraceae bacterium]|jgi:hypothetical protein
MIKHALALVTLAGLAGCAAQSGSQPQAAGNSPQSSQTMTAGESQAANQQAELAAYAGAHQYPATQPARNDLRAAAIVDASQGAIKIYNFGTEPIRDADVWVNQAYVRHIDAIAPGSSISIHMSNLYNGVGQQFSTRGEHVNLVQIQQDHALHTLLGPVPQ